MNELCQVYLLLKLSITFFTKNVKNIVKEKYYLLYNTKAN